MLVSRALNQEILLPFQQKRPVKHIILICDVDGVIRNCTEADADPQIVTLIQELVATRNVDVAFISGSPIAHPSFLETWRRGNHTLDKAVGKFFSRELIDGKVSIFGALGGQKMTKEGHCEITDQYPLDITFELGKLLLLAFMEEVKHEGTPSQKHVAEELTSSIEALKLSDTHQCPDVTPVEFSGIIDTIHSKLDPNYRLVSIGGYIESHTSNPLWKTAGSLQWIKQQLNCPDRLIFKEPKYLAAGLAHRENKGLNFLIVSKTNKGLSLVKYLQEKIEMYPDALIVTIGDTQVDFSMHQKAHLSYHVGLEHVWKDFCLSHCLLVQDRFGRDSQHVNGTLYVLNSIKNNIGKALDDWDIPVKYHSDAKRGLC